MLIPLRFVSNSGPKALLGSSFFSSSLGGSFWHFSAPGGAKECPHPDKKQHGAWLGMQTFADYMQAAFNEI